MWQIIKEGPIQIQKVNTDMANNGLPEYNPKPVKECTSEDKRRYQVEHLAQDIIFGTLDDNYMADIKHCSTTKEIWDYLADLCK